MEIAFALNGDRVTVSVEPSERLLDTLRETLGLTGTKEGCGEGECGSCTVILDGLPANSCLIPTFQGRGREGATGEAVPPDQLEAFLSSGATQGGACSPGGVRTARWIRRNPEILTTHTLREALAGNLCRCTGYDGIIDGLQAWLDQTDAGRGEGASQPLDPGEGP
mgnify:CR=1 FL=1